MPFVSVTRLKLRSIRFVPSFTVHALRSRRQVTTAPGFRGGSLLADRAWTFWTMTVWDREESVRRYMATGPHMAAMPHLLDWCDEASVVRWNRPEEVMPTWAEADERMRGSGRASKVRDPSPRHATLTYQPPRLAMAGQIHPARPS